MIFNKKEYDKEYYLKNKDKIKDKIKEYDKEYNQWLNENNFKEKIKQKLYDDIFQIVINDNNILELSNRRKCCKKCISCFKLIRYPKRNKSGLCPNCYKARYYQKNKDKILEYGKNYRKEHKDKKHRKFIK